jgi:hypothetical protein
MRKIVVGGQVSMDGVVQAPGAPTEDPTKGFKLGGWAMPYFDREVGEELDHVGSAPHSFKMTRSRVSPNGLIVGHYEREGEIRIGDPTLDFPSEREIARQKRMSAKAKGSPILWSAGQ